MIKNASATKWLMIPPTDPGIRVRLFCFPYAGGGAIIFRSWAVLLPPQIAVYPVQLPGRENRMREAPFTRVAPLAQMLATVLEPYLALPFAFFGHSMGALIAFEVARELRRRGLHMPVQLFVGGRPAPQLPSSAVPLHSLPDHRFVDQLRQLGGTPEAVLQNDELMQLLVPLLRADFAVNEAYDYRPEAPLTCPITAFGGLRDTKVSQATMAPWAAQTTGDFRLRMFPGDHFFVNSDATLLLADIARDLAQSLNHSATTTSMPAIGYV